MTKLLLGLIGYQIIGVALLLPVELMFPKVRMSVTERVAGLRFLLITAVVGFGVAVSVVSLKSALDIQSLVTLRGSFGPVIAAVILALWADLQFYVRHRLEHRFLWRFHAVHHSIRNLSAANSYHHWTEPLWIALIGLPLLFVDVEVGPALGLLTFLFAFQQFYIHSSSRPHFGPLRWALIDNRYHRIHHSVEPKHYDHNFGAMTPLWDWLFGTMYMPKSSEWPEVGLKEVEQPNSFAEWESLPRRYPLVRTGGVKVVPLG